MIRFTWLQARAQTLSALAALVVVAIFVLVTGPHLIHLYNTTVAACKARGDCPAAISSFLNHDNNLRAWLGVLVVVVPGILGIFWGAPLVARELEVQTFKVAWTQSVSRRRWMITKLTLVGGAAVAAAGLLSLAVSWWAKPLDIAHANWFTTFDQRDLVPVGYAAFAFVVGVLAGTVIRRTLPAMAGALLIFVGARIAVTQWVRPHLLAASHRSLAVTSAPGLGFTSSGPSAPVTFTYSKPSIPHAWVLSAQLVDRSGRPTTADAVHRFLTTACPTIVHPAPPPSGGPGRRPANQQAFNDCIARIAPHYHLAVTYQPAGHYWPLQWYETGIFVAAATVLAFAVTWWIRRRIP